MTSIATIDPELQTGFTHSSQGISMPLVSMRQLLDHAAENGYGIPAFNVNNLEQVQAIMAAADEVGAPVILQASAGARKYAGEPFIHVSERAPSTKWTQGSNAVHLTARYDARTGRVLAIAALDNLVKGAAGQMIQCANLMLGLDEEAGLPKVGLWP